MTGLPRTVARVAMVSEHASPLATLGGADAGGQNVHVACLAQTLAGAGCEVVVYTRRESTEVAPRVAMGPGVWVEHLDAGPPVQVPKDELLPHMADFAEQLRGRWAADRPDVVHAHFWMSALASRWAARRVGLPVVVTFHALGSVKRRHQGAADTSPPGRVGLERRLMAEVDHIIATCSDERRELEALDASPERITVIPCGVDLDLFSPDGRAEPRRGCSRLVVLGRLVERKGVAEVIDALGDLPGAELVVAGGPPASQLAGDPEARRLMRLAAALGVDQRVEFTGALGRADVPALLRSADVVVCTPWYEPFGMVPLEAMACGVPVVASAVGGITDSVVDGVTGVLVAPRDSSALARAVAALLDDPGRRARMGRAGAERARSLYSWEAVGAATMDVYAEVMAAAGAARAGRAR